MRERLSRIKWRYVVAGILTIMTIIVFIAKRNIFTMVSQNILFILSTIAVICLLIIPKKFVKEQYIFTILALVIGITMAVLNPPNQECDGPDHFYRSMDVSYGNVLGSFVNISHQDGVITVPENVADINYRTLTPNGDEADAYVASLMNRKFSENTILIEYWGSVTSVVYWPQGLGMWIGRTLKLSIYGVILLGRICNLLAYICLTFAAIRIIPFFKNLLMLLALMPITLYQASSLSQDRVLNGMGFLFVALCCYYAFDENVKLSWKKTLPLGLVLLGMFLSKYVYACLGLLAFMIPMRKFESKKEYWKSLVIALLPLVVLGGYVMLRVSPGIGNIQAGAGTGDITQMQFLKANPLHIIKMLFSTVLALGNEYIRQLTVLGSLNVPLVMIHIAMPAFIFVVGCLDVNNSMKLVKVKDRVLMLTAFFLTFAAIIIGLSFDPANTVGSDVIAGVQGRYFILMLMLPFIGLASINIKNEIKGFTIKVSGIMGIMLLYSLLMMLKTYY